MSGYVVQVTLVFILTFINAHAKKPPGYVAPPREYDPNPPKYEYGYRIQDDKATQGKDEQRDGIYAQGRYYVENGTESSQNVKYFADDWGYHPVVEYSNKSPHGKSSTNFALGEEAIKLKNNQKSIPQDPSDPGRAENLAKLEPPSQQLDPSGSHDLPLVTQLAETVPSSTVQTLLIQPQIQAQGQPIENIQPIVVEHGTATQAAPSSLTQANELTDPNSVQPVIVEHQPQPVNPDNSGPAEVPQTQILLPNQPQWVLQSEPHLQLLTVPPDQQLQNRELILDPIPQGQPFQSSPKQPIFYYVQPQQNIPQINTQQPTGTGNQLFQVLHEPLHPVEQNQQYLTLQQPQSQQLQQLEQLPQPQALILENQTSRNPLANGEDNRQFVTNNEVPNSSEQMLETAALIKTPNELVEFESSPPEFHYKEFGAKLNPKYTQITNNKLIESTKSLISGADVLDINAAVSQDHSSNDIETSTLQSLLQQYVTPTIVSNHLTVDVDHEGVISSTTLAPPITTVETGFLREPIVVAELETDSDSKPVTEKTEENNEYISSTARGTLATSTSGFQKGNIQSSSDHVIVTPRPVSSKFLAPITAGVQLQHVEEQIFGDSKTIETHEEQKEKVLVQVQKTIPYYLGMYEYPSGYDAQSIGRNITDMSVNEKAVQDIELGKTLLYFPEPEAPRAEQLIQEQPSGIDIDSNQLLSFESKKETLIEDQQVQDQNQLLVHEHHQQPITDVSNEQIQQQTYLQNGNVQEYIQERPTYSQVTNAFPHSYEKVVEKPVPYPQPYPVEKIVEKPVHIPIEVTKYVDRPYPVEVPVPYPQPYAVEKVVQKVVKEPYPVEVKVPVRVEVPVPHPVHVEKIVERKIPVPYYIEKPVEKIVEKAVEKIVERKVPVPYYIDRPVEKVVEKPVPHYIDRPFPVHEAASSQAYLLQIPGLFSQHKYSTLVHNPYQPQNLQLQYTYSNGHKLIAQNQVGYPVAYAPQNNQYLPPKLANKGLAPPKLKKLNLLVFPRVNIANLPPVTKNPHDLYRNQLSHQSYRFSNAQLNNGYLPPVSSQPNNCDNVHQPEASASSANTYSVKKPEEHHIGLIPPKRPLFDESRKYRHARAHFDDKSIRMEYGFMPPLVPSLEIDEHGQPIEKDDN